MSSSDIRSARGKSAKEVGEVKSLEGSGETLLDKPRWSHRADLLLNPVETYQLGSRGHERSPLPASSGVK